MLKKADRRIAQVSSSRALFAERGADRCWLGASTGSRQPLQDPLPTEFHHREGHA